MEDTTPEERHESKVFQYVNWTTAAILAIVIATFFVPIPANNSKYVDIAIGILLGILSSNSGTVTGNSPVAKKPDNTPTVSNADTVNVDQTTKP